MNDNTKGFEQSDKAILLLEVSASKTKAARARVTIFIRVPLTIFS